MSQEERREEALRRMKAYVRENTCTHLIACAVTPTQVEAAVEMMRSGVMPDAYIGAAMLSGPCTRNT